MIDLIVDLLGEAPNDLILNLYYVLAIVIIIYFIKLVFSIVRSVLGIHSSKYRLWFFGGIKWKEKLLT